MAAGAKTARPSWHRSSIGTVGAIGGLYVAQSVLGGLTWVGLPAVLREQGTDLSTIGLVSLIALPWALKFLWAPAVERYRLPHHGGDRSALVVLAGIAVVVVSLGILGALPAAGLPWIFALLSIAALATATVDIACDGYAVQNLSKASQGWGNTAQVGGAYLGSAIGAGLFLVLVDRGGWALGTWTVAALVALLSLPFLLHARTARFTGERTHLPSLKAALKRPEIRRGLLVAGVYILAQKTSFNMVAPYLIDRGVSLATVGLLSGTASIVLGIAGSFAGGWCVRRFGVRPVLALALLPQALALGFLSLSAFTEAIPVWMIAGTALMATSGVMAFGFVALYTQFMRWSDPRQAGVDFTLFQCMDGLVSLGGGAAAGFLAQHLGYDNFFAAAAMLALLAVPAVAVATQGGTGAAPGAPRPA
ncbi:MFS transporter [Lutibaculum baratangense]|uniref:AmpG permease n=1 Tax=Lutibaculum baratangense AMV1 TaxID=631454 RepID=V4TD11_9HYPH|nr:MFS transporter [Lutibaculum baratangense]ESR24193.1 AmpG permease [Lutibaculum baratangense AMV1]